jgi:ABC-type amino acid transport system permease subunit
MIHQVIPIFKVLTIEAPVELYLFITLIHSIVCVSMSRYSHLIEKQAPLRVTVRV